MTPRSPEQSLVLAAARRERGEPFGPMLEAFAPELDWTALVECACAHGVAGLLCDALLSCPKPEVPEEIRHASAQHLRQIEVANQASADQLCEALSALSGAGIEAIPFKGPTLAMAAYGSLARRNFCDLDFLVQEPQVDACLDVMRSLGYTHEWRLSPRQWRAFVGYAGQDILSGAGLPFEPHWAFAPRTLALGIDYAALWRRTVRKSFNGRTILSLSPEDELTVLCLHGAKEKWNKLKWVVDVAEYLMRHAALDWPSLIARAEAQGIARILALGLELPRQLLDAPIPPDPATWLERQSRAADWAREIGESFFELREPGRSVYEFSRFHWRMRERPRDRLRYLARTLTQPRVQHFGAIAIPDPLFILYTPYKLAHDYLALPLWKSVRARRGRAPVRLRKAAP